MKNGQKEIQIFEEHKEIKSLSLVIRDKGIEIQKELGEGNAKLFPQKTIAGCLNMKLEVFRKKYMIQNDQEHVIS